MGFAGVLSQLGLPRSEFLTALLCFNAGVELGQLTVILTAFFLIGLPFRRKPWYRRRVVVPGRSRSPRSGCSGSWNGYGVELFEVEDRSADHDRGGGRRDAGEGVRDGPR